MRPGVIPILQTKLDLNQFLPAARNVLGYSPAKAADAMTVTLDELPHALSCVAAFKDEKAPASVSWAWSQWDLFSVGFLVVATDLDMVDILETVSGMSVTMTETTERGILAAIVVGTLPNWQRAVLRGCKMDKQPGVRYAFNTIYRHFEAAGLRGVFEGLKVMPQTDKTFLLEDKR